MRRFGLLFISICIVLCLSACSTGNTPRKYVTIQGEVNRPGDYFINNNIPYILVLLEARGYTDNADASKVIVERKNKSVILDLSIPVTKRAPHLAEKFILHPYDIVTVPSKSRTQKKPVK